MRWYGGGIALSLVLAASAGMAQPGLSPLRSHLTGPRLARALSDPSVSRRVEAAEELGLRGAPGPAVDALVEALPSEPARQVRAAIARSLARRGDPRAVPVLVEALADTRGPDAEATVAALAAFATGEAVGALLVALEDAYLQRLASDGLVRIGAKAVPAVAAHLAAAGSRLPLLDVLGRIGSPLATPALLDELSSSDPLVRSAALAAIERIADPRAARAAILALDDPEPSVQRSAVAAVAATGARGDAARLDRFLTGTPEADAPVLRAMLRLDAVRAATALGSASPSPAILSLVLERPRPELLPVYARLAEAPEVLAPSRAGLLGAISAVGDDEAIALLGRLGDDRPSMRGAIAVELALALEREARPISDSARAGAIDAIDALDDPAARLLLLAIAGDPRVAGEVDAALSGDEPRLRAAAALALATTRIPCDAQTVRAVARAGDDPELFRRMAEAAVRCGIPARASVYRPFLYGEDAGPEAMAWAALSVRGGAIEARRALGRELRVALRSPAPRMRAGAARALAVLGDRGARTALARLLEDTDPGVRRAATRAIEVLGAGPLAPELEAAARAEIDSSLRAAIEDAARARDAGPAGFDRRDHASYRLGQAAPAGARIDLVDAVGRHRRFEPAASVPFLVIGLPEGPVRATMTLPVTQSGGEAAPAGTLAVPRLGP